MTVGLGPLALRYILVVGGTGYFRTRAVRTYLKSGKLKRVPGTPKFSYSAYAAYSSQADSTLLDWARGVLVKAAHKLPDQWV